MADSCNGCWAASWPPALWTRQTRRRDAARGLTALRAELREARARVAILEREFDGAVADLARPAEAATLPVDRKPRTVFVDGAFDLTHFGHSNAFRQARLLGDRLLVGVNSDASIEQCKGPPIMNDSERQAAVSACRFVDEIIPCSPYVMTEEYIHKLISEHGVDLFVHGDDPCFVDGRDVYAAAKAAGRFATIPRTEGVSTTDIIGRALLHSKQHHHWAEDPGRGEDDLSPVHLASESIPVSDKSRSLITSNLYTRFLASLPEPKPGTRKIVYIDGAWDMFHAGHISTIRKARALGDWLIAGVHSDRVVNEHKGRNYPIMNMQERTMALLGCRYVDDVVLDAPWYITREMIATLGISLVAEGTRSDAPTLIGGDPHAVPREMGISVSLTSDVSLTVENVLDRIRTNLEYLTERHTTKAKKENDWLCEKHGIDVPK